MKFTKARHFKPLGLRLPTVHMQLKHQPNVSAGSVQHVSPLCTVKDINIVPRRVQSALYNTSTTAWHDLAHFRNSENILKCGGDGRKPTTPFILQRNVADVFS